VLGLLCVLLSRMIDVGCDVLRVTQHQLHYFLHYQLHKTRTNLHPFRFATTHKCHMSIEPSVSCRRGLRWPIALASHLQDTTDPQSHMHPFVSGIFFVCLDPKHAEGILPKVCQPPLTRTSNDSQGKGSAHCVGRKQTTVSMRACLGAGLQAGILFVHHHHRDSHCGCCPPFVLRRHLNLIDPLNPEWSQSHAERNGRAQPQRFECHTTCIAWKCCLDSRTGNVGIATTLTGMLLAVVSVAWLAEAQQRSRQRTTLLSIAWAWLLEISLCWVVGRRHPLIRQRSSVLSLQLASSSSLQGRHCLCECTQLSETITGLIHSSMAGGALVPSVFRCFDVQLSLSLLAFDFACLRLF
jgi:hypothetical protein